MRTKSGLLLAIITTAALALTGCAAKVTLQPETAKFLASKFVTTDKGTYIEGFTPGVPDAGFTLEAIAQLSQSGDDIDISAAEKWILSNTDQIKKDGQFNLGLAAKWLYVSKLVDYDNKELQTEVTDALSAFWKPSYDPSRVFSTFDTAWEALALHAVGKHEEAKRATDSLAMSLRSDNGWGSDLSASTTASSTDATAIALMAFVATGDEQAAGIAKAWLQANMKTDHFEAWGDVDVNGTAYATMALHAAGEDVSALKAWLLAQVVADGGLKTPWSSGAGDTFATSQGYLALIDLDYVGLVK